MFIISVIKDDDMKTSLKLKMLKSERTLKGPIYKGE